MTLLYEFKLKQQISYDNLFRSLFKNLEKLAEFFYFCAILLQTALLLPSSSFRKNVPTGTGTEKYLSNAEFHIML